MIKIHHGAPGSYKSSGAIHTDVIPAIKAGRHIITNVRGFTAERCRNVLGKAVPDSLVVEYIDTEAQSGRDKLAVFYHWAPKGAFFLIDEIQRIFPPSWRQSDLDKLDYPDGPEAAKLADRPETIDVAWDMHRHHNWDFVLTTPNIKKVHSIIRGPAETAIRHTNMGLLGLRGRYKTVLHLSDNSGSSYSDVLQAKPFNKVPKYVFDLYDSTTTGQFHDTLAGSSVLRDPKVLALLAFIFVCIYAGFIHDWRSDAARKAASASSSPIPPDSKASLSVDSSPSNVLPSGGPVVSSATGAFLIGPYSGYRIYLSCAVSSLGTNFELRMSYCFVAKKDNKSYDIDLNKWPDIFTNIESYSVCHVKIKYMGRPVDIYCDPENSKLNSEKVN